MMRPSEKLKREIHAMWSSGQSADAISEELCTIFQDAISFHEMVEELVSEFNQCERVEVDE
jgi:hypothetical protein